MEPGRTSFVICLLTLFMSSCNNEAKKVLSFELHPDETASYIYSVSTIVSTKWQNSKVIKTMVYNFSLDSMRTLSSSINARFHFLNLRLEHYLVDLEMLNTLLPDCHYFVTIGKDGLVENVTGEDSAVVKLNKCFKGNMYATRQFVSQYLGQAAVSDLLSRTYGYSRSSPVAVGTKWVRDYELKSEFDKTLSTMFTAEAIRGDSAYLDVISLTGSKRMIGAAQHYRGNSAGKLILDLTSGLPLSYIIQDTLLETTYAYPVESITAYTLSSKKVKKLH